MAGLPAVVEILKYYTAGRQADVSQQSMEGPVPNGGPDCCGNCSHNRAVQEMGLSHPKGSHDPFWDLSYCTLRDLKTPNPMWTYCPNFRHGKHPLDRKAFETPRVWVSAQGLYEGYVRIPWDDKNEPRVSMPATCAICGRKTKEGIQIDHDGGTLGFCTNRHYVQWWKTIHADESIKAETFESPEKRSKAD